MGVFSSDEARRFSKRADVCANRAPVPHDDLAALRSDSSKKKAWWVRVLAWSLVLAPVIACAATPDNDVLADSGMSTNNTMSSASGSSGTSSGSATAGNSGSPTTTPSSGSATAGSTTDSTEAGSTEAGSTEAGAADDGGDDAAAEGGEHDAGAVSDSSSAADKDGSANACKKKICVDPVFDCPLQGCFAGCKDFFCN